MKKLALIALAAGAAILPQAASAQVFVGPGFGGFNNGFNFNNNFGGFAFGGFFTQPQFHVQNWQLYGFIDPGANRRWIRYYDDAYMIDRGGRVYDHRRGVDWDRYGERWGRDDRGMPVYVGRGDYQPRRRDYERVARERGGYDRGYADRGYDGRGYDRRGGHDGYGYDERYEERGYDRRGYGDARYGGPAYPPQSYGGGWDYSAYGSSCAQACGGYAPPPPPPAYGYGAGYPQGYGYQQGYGCGSGCGYGGAGTVIVTETTVTPITTTTVTEEVIEEVVETRGAVRRHHAAPRRAAPVRRYYRPAPPPVQPSGERG